MAGEIQCTKEPVLTIICTYFLDLETGVSEDSVEFDFLFSKTQISSSFTSLEHHQTVPLTVTDGELDDSRFPLASHFPPQDSSDFIPQSEGPSLPAFWLIFRVGSTTVQAFFHHSDSHRETSILEATCPHCVVFRRALDDIRSVLRLVNQSLLLDQLVLDRFCDPALFPEVEEAPLQKGQRPPRHLQLTHPTKRNTTPSPGVAVSASSATDSDNADIQPVTERKKSILSNQVGSPTLGSHPPGSLACPSKFTFSLEVSPRAVIAGEKGNQVLPELRRLLENFVVMNRKNMFVFDDSEPVVDSLKPAPRKNLIPRIFYMLLQEVPFESAAVFDTTCRVASPSNSPHKDNLPHSFGGSSTNLNRIQLQATLHGVSQPSRHFCNFVRTLLQSLLDKIVLECLHQVLSRTVLFRFTSYDFDYLFARRPHQPRHQLFFTLPRFLTDPSKVPYVPRGALVLPFCQYLKQNFLTCMTVAKPEKEVLPCLRNCFGCGEVMLYYRRRGVGTAKLGLVTVVIDLLCTGTMEPFCIKSCLDLREWLRCRGANETSTGVASVQDLEECLTDIEFSHDTPPPYKDRLAIRLRLWERGEVDISLLTQSVTAAVQNTLYDLIIEYFVLSLPACLIEVPVFKSRSSEIPIEMAAKSTSQVVSASSIRLSECVSVTLLPWLSVGNVAQVPFIIERRMQLASLQSVDLLVGELVYQLNALIEERIGRPISCSKCLCSTSESSAKVLGRVKSTTMQQLLATTACLCQQCINFFAFESLNEGDKSDWVRFSKGAPLSQRSTMFVQQREFVIIGRNYAVCRYQAVSLGKQPSNPSEDRLIPVKQS